MRMKLKPWIKSELTRQYKMEKKWTDEHKIKSLSNSLPVGSFNYSVIEIPDLNFSLKIKSPVCTDL